jgi:hypothetical protein
MTYAVGARHRFQLRARPPWIEIVLIGEDLRRLGGHRLALVLPDGTHLERRLDEGVARFDEIPAGTCLVRFPGLDRGAWSVDEEAHPETGGPVTVAKAPGLQAGPHRVQEGESVSSIAERSGHFWRTLWDHPGNRALRELRQNPNVLSPGDALEVPPLAPGEASVATGRRYVVKRHGIPARLRLRLLDNGAPRANQEWRLVLEDGGVRSGTTGEDGTVETFVPAQARRAALTIGGTERQLAIGGLRPAGRRKGAAQRLANLGLLARGAGTKADAVLARLREQLEQRGLPSGPADAMALLERLHDLR